MNMWKTSLVTLVTWLAVLKNGQCQMAGFGGGRGMGGMSFGLAMRGEIPPQQYMLLDSAVKQIIGPAASPTPAMIAVAMRQGGPPTTLPQMIQYTPHFMMVARQLDVKPPGIVGRPTTQQLQNYIMQRSTQWMQTNMGLQAMNVDPTMGMMMNANPMGPAPPALAVAPANPPVAAQTQTRSPAPRPVPAAAAPSMGNQGMGGMGMNNMFNLMAFGGMEGLGLEGLGMGLF